MKIKLLAGSLITGIFGGICAVELQLVLRDHNGARVERPVVKKPYQLEAVIKGDVGNASLTIDHLQQSMIRGQRSSSSMHMINGATTVERRISYTVVFDTEGQLTLGPAHIQSKSVSSNSLPLTVVAEEEPSASKKSSVGKPRCQLIIEKNSAMMGEEIPVRIRVSGLSERYACLNLRMPHVEQGLFAPFEGPFVVNDAQGDGIEWRGAFYSERTGTVIIPSFIAECEDREATRDFFTVMLMPQARAMSCASSEVSITIDPIPAEVQGVGLVHSYAISVSPPVVKSGEAATVHVTLKGDGNLALWKPEAPSSDHLTCYLSKNEYDEQLHQGTHVSEYVVHATRAGEYTIQIPPFVYYDTQTKKVREIFAKPCVLRVEQSQNSIAEKKQEEQVAEKPVESILEKKSEKKTENFFMVFVGAVCIAALGILYWWLRQRRLQPGTYAYKKRALKNVLKACRVARETNSTYALYQAIFELCTALRGAPVDDAACEKLFDDARWKILWQELMRTTFDRMTNHATVVDLVNAIDKFLEKQKIR